VARRGAIDRGTLRRVGAATPLRIARRARRLGKAPQQLSDVDLVFLTDGGQPAGTVRDRLLDFIGGAHSTLDLAIYDAHFEDDSGTKLIGALDAAEARGVVVRAVYNDVSPRHGPALPPQEGPSLLAQLAAAVPAKAIPGVPDLMHHKYVVRDATDVWTGSTNWTTDSWTRQENVLITLSSADLAVAYAQDFAWLWTRGEVEGSGRFDDEPAAMSFEGAPLAVRALFSPGRGRAMGQLVARRLAEARRRIRICSPVLTSAPILGTLAEILDDKRCDTRVAIDGTQMDQALANWQRDGRAGWKVPLFERVRSAGVVAEKHSTPWPASPHDYLHAKVVVADDVVLTGSYNCSHSGEFNAENLLEIRSASFADRCAAFVEAVHTRYS
jgi:phosphatidylserine/phosphatidylglycerophosphate/cardiolipin synthase-like enzyme